MITGIIEYEPRYYQCALRYPESIAILVVAYNRPEYFKEALASMEKNPESQTLPFFFFLDGGPEASQQQNEELILNSSIVYQEIIMRHRNYGCAKNLIDARRFLFDWCKFEKVIVIEEDMMVTRYYFRTLLRLHHWAKARYNNVGVVQCWSYCYLEPEAKKAMLPDVQIQENYWWSFVTYCLDQDVWRAISPILYAYETCFVDKIPWTEELARERSKPGLSSFNLEIRGWVKQLIENRPAQPLRGTVHGQQALMKRDLQELFALICYDIANQDMMTGFALWMSGYVKLETVVNRARHIGKVGVTLNEQRYEDFQHHRIMLDEFDEDADLADFRWIPE